MSKLEWEQFGRNSIAAECGAFTLTVENGELWIELRGQYEFEERSVNEAKDRAVQLLAELCKEALEKLS